MSKALFLSSLCQATISHSLWGKCKQVDEAGLSRHRADTEKKLEKLNLPASVYSYLKQGLSLCEKSYHHAYHWLKIYKERIPCLKYWQVDIFNGQYCFSQFMTPLGEFNDESWVIKFVHDKRQDLLDKFCLASFYCLEKPVKSLWREIKNTDVEIELLQYSKDCELLKGWIAYLCEGNNYAHTYSDHLYLNLTFYACFVDSCNHGHDKGITYLWSYFSPFEHMIFKNLDGTEAAHNLRLAARNGYPKTVHSLYLCLSQAEQFHFLESNFIILPNVTIWQYYLKPLLLRFIPDQLLSHQHSLPESSYSEFLYHLACKIRETKEAVYQELFDTVWKIDSVENRSYFLQNDQETFLALCIAKDFDNIRCILKEASWEQKRCFLMKSADQLFNGDTEFGKDSWAIRTYLEAFVTNFCGMNRKMTFHTHSLSLLKEIQLKYMKCLNFSHVLENLISEISNYFKLSDHEANEFESINSNCKRRRQI